MKKLEYTIQKIEFVDDYSNRAEATIKCGETKFEIEIDNDGEFEVPNELKLVEGLVGKFDPKPLAEKYKVMVGNIKRYREEQEKQRRREAYLSSWVHKIEDPQLEGMVVAPNQTEEQYVSHQFGQLSIKITYKGKEADVKYEKIYSSGNWGYRHGAGTWKYVLSSSVTDYNRRNYSSFENAAKKFKKIVDEKAEIEDSQAMARKAAAIQRQETVNSLTDEFGRAVCESEYRPNYGRPGFGYDEWVYYILRDEKKYKITPHKDGTYDFARFSNLTADQVRGILDIVHPTS